MNPECSTYRKDGQENMELRAHHLFTLSRLHFLGVHKAEWREKLVRNLKKAQLSLLGRGQEFSDHLINSTLAILKKRVGTVKLTDTYDEVCKKCPQRKEGGCQVAGREWTENFLSLIDQAVIRNTNGLLEIGGEYTPEYLVENMGAIRKAMRKTLLELPGLWKMDRKLNQ